MDTTPKSPSKSAVPVFVAVYFFLVACFSAVSSIAIPFLMSIGDGQGPSPWLGWILFVLFAVFAAFCVWIGVGILKRKSHAKKTAKVVAILLAAWGIFGSLFITGDIGDTILFVLSVLAAYALFRDPALAA